MESLIFLVSYFGLHSAETIYIKIKMNALNFK